MATGPTHARRASAGVGQRSSVSGGTTSAPTSLPQDPMLRGWIHVQHGEKSCLCMSTAVWRRRFCVVKNGKMFIYESEQV